MQCLKICTKKIEIRDACCTYTEKQEARIDSLEANVNGMVIGTCIKKRMTQ